MVGDGDVAAIFENGDWNVDAVFTISTGPTVTLTVKGWFQEPAAGVDLMPNVEIGSSRPSFTAPTANLTTIRTKMKVTISGTIYQVEAKDDTGIGHTVVWLKDSNA